MIPRNDVMGPEQFRVNDTSKDAQSTIYNDHGVLISDEIDYTIRVAGLTILTVIILMSIIINDVVVSYGSVS